MRITSQFTTPPARAAAPLRDTPKARADSYEASSAWLIPAALVGGAGMSLLATWSPPAAGAAALTAGLATTVACWPGADDTDQIPLSLLLGAGAGAAVGTVGGLGAVVGRHWAHALGGPIVSGLAGGAAAAAFLLLTCNAHEGQDSQEF